MAKKINAVVKLQLPGGKATPGPPVGSTLGPHGINIPGFTKEFNERTKEQVGLVIPVVITIFADRSFSFITKTPPVAVQILEVLKVKKGSAEPNITKVSSMSWDQVRVIAEDKMQDLNCFTVGSAMMMVAGTARSMGITVKGKFPASN